MRKQTNYTVYKHVCPNGKVYIGVTMQKPYKRWRGGMGYYDNPHFFRAIVKYGWDNIKHEILYEGLSEEDAFRIEKQLVAEYKSNNFAYGYIWLYADEKDRINEKLEMLPRGRTASSSKRYSMKMSKLMKEKYQQSKDGKRRSE